MDQPDKQLFNSFWEPPAHMPGTPPGAISPGFDAFVQPAAFYTFGNLQHIWKDTVETSDQFFANLTLPFQQWSGDKGYVKVGVFDDVVDRTYKQNAYSNFSDPDRIWFGPSGSADWSDFWSAAFPSQQHNISASLYDVSYTGKQEVSAWYCMADLPTCHYLDVIGGVRFEKTSLSTVNKPDPDPHHPGSTLATWFPPGDVNERTLLPGEADVSFEQSDVLPSIGLLLKPIKTVMVHACYSETVARPTFREITPIRQEEYLGADIFVGNPDLKMSSVKNYDLRADYTPYTGTLVSAGWFRKDVTDPIEYVQVTGGTTQHIQPTNYPKGWLSGVEAEVRQKLGNFWKPLGGLTVGANGTLIDSQVTLPMDQLEELGRFGLPTRDMMNAPKYLYNLFTTYDIERYGLQIGLFYTVRGDALVAGFDGSERGFVPSVYEKEYGSFNLTVAKKLGKYLVLKFQAKNLTNPEIETVYRSKFIGSDVVKSSFQAGREFWVTMTAQF
jgi:TonB-dependent receptor